MRNIPQQGPFLLSDDISFGTSARCGRLVVRKHSIATYFCLVEALVTGFVARKLIVECVVHIENNFQGL